VADKNITSDKPTDSVSRLTCMEPTSKRVNMQTAMLDMTINQQAEDRTHCIAT